MRQVSPNRNRRQSSSSSLAASARQRRQVSILALRYAGCILMPCLLYMCLHLMHTASPSRKLSSTQTCLSENIIAYFYQPSLSGTKDNFQKSLQLLHDNYLLLNHNNDAVDVIIFHTGELQDNDFEQEEWTKTNIRLVPIKNELPTSVQSDSDPSRTWIDYPEVSLDRRHEHHFWSIGIWDYLKTISKQQHESSKCSSYPRFLWRMDTNAFLYSPIPYNLFDFMKINNYQYGFRLCQQQQRKQQHHHSVWEEFFPNYHHSVSDDSYFDNCQLDDSFLLADIKFFQSRPVQKWFEFLQVGGYIYRHNLSPSVIHSLALQAYATSSSNSIHRFLDFTLHVAGSNVCQTTAFQAGHADADGQAHVEEWLYYWHQQQHKDSNHQCLKQQQPRIEYPTHAQLTPRLTHLPKDVAQTVQLPTLVVE
mmetsp:Transcript_16436/g.24242  ORF Transcript_16436/g.24242 Transcript_16436/m.24242 type:complete len:420 (-) Transcript_16436:280-1539(-)|eukprot:CAMPEP_0194213994 /NCGR_PEP_ID=MMETSP0156-20130528/14969_1 /TAXON_ID=33649 /ORGANISM="Thalassionema nitzschioides, Strain L26-B" /LENGTH=419 /DNA_ID=CAMNT_0038942157 /DNA_START=55 /DNA_END=1314 /DNA_ORIENTATION=+